MASYLFKVFAVLVLTNEPSFGTRDAHRRFRFPEYPLRDIEAGDGSYSVEPEGVPYITHMDTRFKSMLDTQPERTPVFLQTPEEPKTDGENKPTVPVTELAARRPEGVGHRLLGDQQSLQLLSAGNETNEPVNIKTIIMEKPTPSQQETPVTVSELPIQPKQEIMKAMMVPILLKPFYTILQKQEVPFEVPQLPVIVNVQTNADTFRFPPQVDAKNDQTAQTKPPTSSDYITGQINCEELKPTDPNTRVMTQGGGKSLPPSRHQPTAGKSYEFAPSALPLVGGLPHDSARLQILSENPHHIFIHPPKVFPVTPSPELSGPLLGGPPIKPTTTTQSTPSRLSLIYQGMRRPNIGRTLFFESKPQQNLQTLQQQMYPIRTRQESLPDMQPVQYYLQPASRLNMQYPIGSLPIATQSNQEQMLLMVQRRYLRNYNNRDLLPYMQPVAVLMMPSESTYPKTEQN